MCFLAHFEVQITIHKECEQLNNAPCAVFSRHEFMFAYQWQNKVNKLGSWIWITNASCIALCTFFSENVITKHLPYPPPSIFLYKYAAFSTQRRRHE